jgi:predicted Zn-dependent protease
MHRQALTAAGLFVALTAGAAAAEAQYRGQTPDENTPRILVPTFRSAERNLGVQGADAIRGRVTTEYPIKQLWVIPKEAINQTLEASGYKPDSALSPNDIRELAKLMRADEIIDGVVTKTPDGVRVEARLLLSRDVALAQPLGTIDAKNVGDAAKSIAKELTEARKQLKDNRDCENALRAGEHDKAIAAAQKGIAAYPKATLARLCLVSALSAKKAPAADVLRAADEVLAIDRTSRIALGLKYGAQRESGDQDGAVNTLVAMLAADPHNMTLQQQVVEALATSNKPELAIPIIDTLVAQNPGDPQMVRTQWLVLLRANQFKRGLVVGEELAKIDTTAADSSWFTRMIATAAADSQPQRAVEYAARATQKFPRSANFYVLQSQLLRRAGQIPQSVAAMQQAVAIDPKVPGGYTSLVVGFAELNQHDSAQV